MNQLPNWASLPLTVLCGKWIADYPGHPQQTVRISVDNDRLQCRKVTGDDYIPAGELTWEVDLMARKAHGWIASLGHTAPRTVPGKIELRSPDRIIFHWDGFGSAEFRMDEPAL